jgi:hypothetical protein
MRRLATAWRRFFGTPSLLAVVALGIWLGYWWIAVIISIPTILLLVAFAVAEARRHFAKPS